MKRKTNKDLQALVRASHGRVMQSCWIAHRKCENGLRVISRRTGERRKPCPPKWEAVIDEAMRELGWL
ncbi:hypothetical protein [Burkholderia vietnamiensis]|uniref:hypothetical protein n=1 Tax=Burkholderia vietnamiensis TaxID=60552 RepID=UPI000AABDDEA|nr:hypothetical protein [Burkholderia vietnamiensis]